MRARDLCSELVGYLTGERIFKSYASSGRFVDSQSSASIRLDGDARMLLHYGACQGPLYQDLDQWRRLFRLIGSFTVASAASRENRPWRIQSAFGSLGASAPSDILTHFESSLSALGLSRTDRSDTRLTVNHALGETVTVMDLPEPYGKWLQHQEKRARWQEPTDVSFRMEARVVSRLQRPTLRSPEAYTAHIDLEMSAPAVNLVEKIYSKLVAALQIEPPLSQTALRRDLLSKIEGRLLTL